MKLKLLVTGGYGFIGSHVVEEFWRNWDCELTILDAMTYAANPSYLRKQFEGREKPYEIIADLRDQETIERVIKHYRPDIVIHLAAESHVCNSIKGPRLFYETNVMGTVNLMEGIRKHSKHTRFLHVSTDEVFGELDFNPDNRFSFDTPLDPRSPYSSSKAASDFVIQAYRETYGIHSIITNCTNNYGPNQHYEKLIPRVIQCMYNGQAMPVHGSGENVRDWIYVKDHARGIRTVIEKGVNGQRYLFGGDHERTNLETIKDVQAAFKKVWENRYNTECPALNIEHNNDRPTDDRRYAVWSNAKNLGWIQSDPQIALMETVEWYFDELEKQHEVKHDKEIKRINRFEARPAIQ